MKKALILSKDDEQLQLVSNEILEFREMIKQRGEFIKKQVDQITEEKRKFHKESWDKITRIIESKNVLPEDYSHDKYTLSHDDSVSVFFIEPTTESENDTHPFSDLLKHLFGQD